MNINKILIVKLGSIGDVIHTLPALEMLKQNSPKASVSWLIEPKALSIIQNNPFLDKIFTFKRSLKDFLSIIKKIRQEKFDYAIDFQGTSKSRLFCMLSNAKYRVGYDKTREKLPFAYNKTIKLKTMEKHAVDRNIELLENLGMKKPNQINFKLNFVENEKNKVNTLLKESNINKYCIISGSAGKPANRWEMKKFSELADKIVEKYNLDVIFIGNKMDSFFNHKIIINTKQNKIHNLADLLSLKETCYLISNSKFTICGDTGPMHMAVAVNCPVIALFGGSNPQRTGPYQGKNYIIHNKVECAPCYKKKCKNNFCLTDIDVDQVLEKCGKIIIK